MSIPRRKLIGVDAAPPPAFGGGLRRGDRALGGYSVSEDQRRVVELGVGDAGADVDRSSTTRTRRSLIREALAFN